MAMPDVARRYTVDEVMAFPYDGNRYEVVQGELLVTPSPSQVHQLVLRKLIAALSVYLEDQDAFVLFPSPADVIWDPDAYVQPDLFVAPSSEVTGDWRDCQHLVLAVEVLSPSSAHADRVTKRLLYQRQRVGTYWIVDPDARCVEVWHPADERPEIVTAVLRWRVTEGAPETEIPLDHVFRGMPG